jgi:P-type conjugative transfer protein TrbJ
VNSCLPHRFRAPRRFRAGVLARLLALALGLAPAGAPPAAAQIPVTDLAHITVNSTWHYAHYVQFAYQIVQQYQQILNQVRQIDAQLRALQKLAQPQWRDLSGLLGELDRLTRGGRALSYALADVAAQFRATFPGWQSWSDATDFPAQNQRALDTLGAALSAVGRQAQGFAADEATLARIRVQMATTAGHQQALEQLSTLAAFTAQEQLLTRQALAASANVAAVAGGYWLNRDAHAEATCDLLATETALAGDRNASRGWSFQPAWWPFY